MIKIANHDVITRFSPLTEFFANELKLYEKFIIDLMDSGMLTKSEDNYYLHYWKKNAGFMNIKISPFNSERCVYLNGTSLK